MVLLLLAVDGAGAVALLGTLAQLVLTLALRFALALVTPRAELTVLAPVEVYSGGGMLPQGPVAAPDGSPLDERRAERLGAAEGVPGGARRRALLGRAVPVDAARAPDPEADPRQPERALTSSGDTLPGMGEREMLSIFFAKTKIWLGRGVRHKI